MTNCILKDFFGFTCIIEMFMYITECQEDRELTVKATNPVRKTLKDVLVYLLYALNNFRKPCDEKERTQVKSWRSTC